MLGYAWNTLGWFLAGVALALGLLLVPLGVAAERKKLDETMRGIIATRHEIHALQTEFATRSTLTQLDRWNNTTLRLVAPAASQFVGDEAALAAIDVGHSGGGAGATKMAAFVPAPMIADFRPAGDLAAEAAPGRSAPAPGSPSAPASPAAPVATATAQAMVPAAQKQKLRDKAQAVAMLDRQLLSDSTVGDLLNGARAEGAKRR